MLKFINLVSILFMALAAFLLSTKFIDLPAAFLLFIAGVVLLINSKMMKK